MSDEATTKKTIQFDEGEATLALMNGQVAERGKPIEVEAELADELLQSGVWYEVGKGPAEGVALKHDHKPESEEELREQELAERPEPTDAAKEKAKEEEIDLDKIDGSGGREGDQVTVADVKEAVAETPPAVPPPADAASERKPRR